MPLVPGHGASDRAFPPGGRDSVEPLRGHLHRPLTTWVLSVGRDVDVPKTMARGTLDKRSRRHSATNWLHPLPVEPIVLPVTCKLEGF